MKENEQYCITCKTAGHSFDQAKSVFRYTGEMKNAMYRFKYGNRRCYGDKFANHAIKNYGNWIKEKQIDVIIPVPMYDKKKKRRGYNQAEVFANSLSKIAGIPVESGFIRRNTDTVAMKQLNRLKRKKNLLKAFTIIKNDVQFRKVLIVDDIYTTGSTLDEVARVLKDGGVKEVYGLCICAGQL
ncbi:comF family protein [Pseudobutyrivibrio sp. OR37]|uniref:ComF family protein n=1 Tax=Pseudobutyrivibrio sp. OR37 TaxID=1798186 RepID=UPI0008E6F2B8|nr:ComF family protein [Pseudobutyrivibrio sp. OR37]SFH74351.1 comF family protein [Pseudobutyrivibrio sp. OR37]